MKKFMAILAVVALTAFAAPVFADTNPFMDVPAGHWSYDAVAQLASRGVVSGYPDGAYKGAQPTTRYEMASLVARSLAQIDMAKASKGDVELLKRLVLEFKNELDALGVKVNDLDKRVAVLEDGIGGWKIRGVFRFDAKFAHSDTNGYLFNQNGKKNEFSKERFRLFLTKTIDENTYFYAQYRTGGNGAGGAAGSGLGDQDHGRWSHLYVDTKVFGDGGLRVGRFDVDFEDDYGLYIDDDALFASFRTDGFRLTKSFGMLNATAVIGRNNTDTIDWGSKAGIGHSMAYILNLNFQPNEKFFIGASGYWYNEDSVTAPVGTAAGDYDIKTYGIYAGYSFTPNVALKGIYYFQDLGKTTSNYLANNDSPKAWKAILDVKQEALKFTSLWVEYSQVDNNFTLQPYSRYNIGATNAYILANTPLNVNTSKIWFAKASQQWNDKWNTFVRFATVNFDTDNLDNATEWGLGVGYQYTPAINFELSYVQVDYGQNGAYNVPGSASIIGGAGAMARSNKESVVRFRTTVSF